MRVRTLSGLFVFFLAFTCAALHAQHSANSNATYQQLRDLMPGNDVITVSNLVLHRDAAVFTFKSGNIAFFPPVNGKVTGAVFIGDGHLHIDPPTDQERHNLIEMGRKSGTYAEDFDQVVMRFTDDTAEELRKASAGKGAQDDDYAKAAANGRKFLRDHSASSYTSRRIETLGNVFYYRKIEGNLDLRLLEDVLSPAAGSFFWAEINGAKHPHTLFVLDPHGVGSLAPEEVALMEWNNADDTVFYPLAFYRSSEYVDGAASATKNRQGYSVSHENLDITIQKNGELAGIATVTLHADQDGVAVAPLNLYPSLRVSAVEDGSGKQLDWVQEGKSEDWDFGVILARPLKKDETATIKITYAGKDVVFSEGAGNYYPVARENWYPNFSQGLSNYASYEMTFHVPKGLQLIATGTKVSEKTSSKETTTEWKTEVPLPVVGFTLGDFQSKDAAFSYQSGGGLTVDAYANANPPDFISHWFANRGLGTLNTTPMLESELDQGKVAAEFYTNYYGILPFSHISLTQQTDCSYGQSWPMLVYLPICGFFDDTQRHFLLGSDWYVTYWKIVTPHEVAHQWWGQTVGFRSYRDQWMSEGFANESAAIYLQATNQMDLYLEFWKQERKLIAEKNSFGFRPIDVGPLTMGSRLNSPKAGWDIYENLIYPKGSYILHMLRMMMWTPRDGDARFKATMQDFVASHRLQAATTEDFKAAVERHMSPQMDLDGNHRMDWFFNEYVYGTDLPAYHFESQATPNDKGTSLHLKLTQSGVPASFKMLVPIYLELADGKVMRMGSFTITGDKTIDQTVQLPKLEAAVKGASINHYYDVLSTDD